MARQTNGRRVSTGYLFRASTKDAPVLYVGQVLTTAPVEPGRVMPVGGYAEFGAGFISIRNRSN